MIKPRLELIPILLDVGCFQSDGQQTQLLGKQIILERCACANDKTDQ